MKPEYRILIQWSTEDRNYIVSLPEFGPYAHTHGDTYADAIDNGEEVLELLTNLDYFVFKKESVRLRFSF